MDHSFQICWFDTRTDRRCALLCTATNTKLVTFLFWTAKKTNYSSKCSDFQKKLNDTISTSNFYLKFKENSENDMAAQVFCAVFYSSWRPSQIGPTADFDGAAIPPSIFSKNWELNPTKFEFVPPDLSPI